MVLISIVLWLASKEDLYALQSNPVKSLNQLAAIVGATLILIQAILATRIRIFERLFGGLDEMYKAHRISGTLGLAIIVEHPVMLILNVLPQYESAQRYLLPGLAGLDYTSGIIALYSLLLLIMITLFLKLPYHIWKWTHILMFIPAIFILIHLFTINSDIATFLPLRIWLLGLASFAIFSSIYIRFFYNILAPKYKYRVISVKVQANVVEIQMAPEGKAIKFQAGQFIYLELKDAGISSEKHPFSIMSAPGSEVLEIAVKMDGDYTKSLKNLKQGAGAVIYGPYGQFGHAYNNMGEVQVWIAGGIGITPFISLLRNEKQYQSNKRIYLYYCVRSEEEALFDERIRASLHNNGNIQYLLRCSVIAGRLDIPAIMNDLKNDIPKAQFLLCGPRPMMEALQEQLILKGITRSKIFYEDFSLLG